MPPSSPRIALIGCGKQKASRTCAAQELYRSPLFKAALRYAVATCDRFYILSAKHGLLLPDAQVEPYELSLVSLSAAEKAAWGRRVGEQLDSAVPYPAEANATIVFLAGERYADNLDLGDREFHWEEPLAGRGIGERIAWLKANARIPTGKVKARFVDAEIEFDTPETAAEKAKQARAVGDLFASIIGGT